MAAVSGGLSGTLGDIFNDSSIQTEDEACKTTSTATSSDVLLTDLLNCDNIIENDEFVYLFTSESSTAPVSTDHSCSNSTNIRSSQLVEDYDSDGSLLSQSEIDNLDSNLQNLPKELYISKLLELCLSNESLILWYRGLLCTRARKFKDCPTGNLINRKTTKASSSAEKYARDCFTLYMFINSEKHGIENVFEKNRTSNSSTGTSDVKRIEKRVVLQTLLERVSKLEHSLTECNKELKSLHVEHNKLKTDYNRLNAEATSRFSRYDSSHKLIGDKFKQVETDIHQTRCQNQKVNDETKRLSKVTQNIQKQIQSNTLSPAKSYAIVTSDGPAIETKSRNSSEKHDHNTKSVTVTSHLKQQDKAVNKNNSNSPNQSELEKITQAIIASPSVSSQERREASHMDNQTHKNSTC